MKRKLLFVAALFASVLSGGYAWAQEDVTSKYLTNASFDEGINFVAGSTENTVAAKVYDTEGWTAEVGGNSTGAILGYGYTGSINGGNAIMPQADPDGKSEGGCLFIAVGWSGTVTYKSTEVTLEPGYYKLKYKAYNGNNKKGTASPSKNITTMVGFAATDGDSKISNVTATFTEQEWAEDTYTFSVDTKTSGSIQIGMKPIGNTYSHAVPELFIDNVTILYFENEDALKLYEAQTSLADAIKEVTAMSKNNVGEGVFQIPASEVKDLTEAIAEAQKAYDNIEATAESLEQAETALTVAKEAYTKKVYESVVLNIPGDKPYNIINVSAGYGPAGNALTFKSASDADLSGNTTSMGWTEKPGSIYPQGVKFIPVKDVVNGYILSYERADGDTIYVGTGASTGLVAATEKDAEWKIRPTTEIEKALTIRVVASAEKDNVWYLYNTRCSDGNGGYYRLGGNGSNDSGLFTGEANGGNGYTHYPWYDMEITPAAEYTAEVKIAGGKYSTVIVPFDVAEIDADVYSVAEEDVEGNVLNLQKVDGIKAHTPYIVYAEEAIETLSGIGAAYQDKSTFTDGLLTGTYGDGQKVPAGSYVLQTQDNVQAFYAVEGNDFSHTQYRAYLTYAPTTGGDEAEGGSIKALYFNFADGDATAIKAVPEVAEGAEKVFYNLAGQRVANPTKGIYIVNGQKVLVK